MILFVVLHAKNGLPAHKRYPWGWEIFTVRENVLIGFQGMNKSR